MTVAEVASSADIAGAASLAVAEVASLADIAGAAIAGVASLAVAGAAPSADIAGAASQGVAGVASSADIVGAASPAVAGVTSSADGVGVASLTDLVGDGCISGMNAVKCENDSLADSTYPDVDFPHSDSQSRIWQERDPDIIRAPGSVAVLPMNKDLPEEEHEAIVVRAIVMGAPWFLTGWEEGTEVEFVIDTGCQCF